MATEAKLKVTLDSGVTITFALFKNLESCKEIRRCVMSGSLDCSLLKTNMILNVFQVQAAAFKAVQLYRNKSMVTKNVHSEILYCLSPSKNITESFKSFGVSDGDTSLFAVLVDDNEDERFNKLSQIVGKSPVSVENCTELAHTKSVVQAYKLTDEELATFPLLDAVVSRIAAKEIITAGKGKR